MLKTTKYVLDRFSFLFPTGLSEIGLILRQILVTKQTPGPHWTRKMRKMEMICELQHLGSCGEWCGVVWCGVVWSDLLWWLLYCSWCGGWGGGGCHMLLPGGLLVRAHCGNSHCGGRGAIWWWLVLWLDWTGCEARWEEDRQGGRQCWAPPHSVTATSYISLHQHHHTN